MNSIKKRDKTGTGRTGHTHKLIAGFKEMDRCIALKRSMKEYERSYERLMKIHWSEEPFTQTIHEINFLFPDHYNELKLAGRIEIKRHYTERMKALSYLIN